MTNAEAPLFDVIILSWNRASDTIEMVASVLRQRENRFHIWIVDQGSDSDELRLLRDYVAPHGAVTLHELSRNVGVAAGRNIASRLGSAPFIVSLDNDALLDGDDCFGQILDRFARDEEVAVLSFRILNYYTGLDDPLSWAYPQKLRSLSDQEFEAISFNGGGHAIRREAFEAVGGYDDSLFFYWEELDLVMRLVNRGRRIVYFPTVRLLHKVSPERRERWSDTRYYYLVRNRLYVGFKYDRSLRRFLLLAGGYLFKGFFNGLYRAPVTGAIDAIRMCRSLRQNGSSAQLPLSPTARRMVEQYNRHHRGSLVQRLRREVFVRLPGQG